VHETPGAEWCLGVANCRPEAGPAAKAVSMVAELRELGSMLTGNHPVRTAPAPGRPVAPVHRVRSDGLRHSCAALAESPAPELARAIARACTNPANPARHRVFPSVGSAGIVSRRGRLARCLRRTNRPSIGVAPGTAAKTLDFAAVAGVSACLTQSLQAGAVS
jgi:hypothetical protein